MRSFQNPIINKLISNNRYLMSNMSRFQIIKGIPFPNVPWFKKENIEGTLEYVPKDGDIIVASYPKTGTTWIQYIVLQIISKAECLPSFNDVLERVAPFMEMTGPEVIDSLAGCRTYKNHYPYDVVKKNSKSKVIYVYRNPEDTFTSFFHFLENALEQNLNMEEFFEGFLTGNIEYGSYFEHVLSYLNHKNDDNLLLVSYEKLHANPKQGILRIAKFLGDKYYQDISTNESLLNKIVKNTSFDHLKKNINFQLPHKDPEGCPEKSTNHINLFRKGTVGDGKNFLSVQQIRRLREKLNQVMKGTEVLKEWIKE